ncbi:MAG: hypothetical protein J6X19_01835 [Clostridia bacterium]|nr:hypothetical protein [Clostridia bacterium]
MGEEYLLEETCSGAKDLFGTGDVYDRDTLYWIGYVYRYWHFYTGESSTKILRQAPVDTMKRTSMMFHTMDPSLAVEKLKEISITASRVSDQTRPARQTPHRL